MGHRGIFHGDIEQSTLLIDIATRNVVRLVPSDSVGEAARLMAEKRISSIVLMDGDGHPAGIVTERDMLRAMQSRCPPETALWKVMSSPVITVPESMTCLDAYQVCLRDGIRHLVIVDDDRRLLGVVSETDFRLHINLTTLAGRRQVAAVMSRSVFSLPPDACLQEALDLMQSHRDTCVVVAEAERPLGIVTERDIVRLYSGDPERIAIPLREIMASPVLAIPLDNTINEAAERMLTAKVRHLVVVDHAGRMAGLLSEHDLTQTVTLGLIDDKLIAEGAFLQTLIKTIPDMVWLKDVKGAYLACNPRFERFFGAKEKDIVGKTDYAFVDKALADAFREHDRMAMQRHGVSVNEEWITFADDGHRELLETLRTPMRDNQGKLMGVLGIARDITGRKQAEEVLAQSEQRYRTLVENAPFCIHEIDLDGRLLSMNRAGLDMLGLDDEKKICGVPYLSAVSEKDSERIKTLLRDAYNGTASHFEFTAAADGPTYFKSCFIPIRDADGKLAKLMGLTEDISERKRLEQQLAERESLFRAIFEQAPSGIELIDPETLRFVEANPAACRKLGYTREEYLGLRLTDIQADMDEQALRAAVRQVGASDGASFENRHLCKNGDILYVEINSRMLQLPGKRLLVGVWHDVTDRRMAEDALRIAASVFDNSQEAILITDANNAVMEVNHAFTQITGYSREEMLGQDPKLLNSGRQDAAFYAAMWRSLKQNRKWRGELWNRRKSGEIYAELLSISVICDDDGKVQRHVGVFSDISHLKAHEAELSRVANYDALTGVPNRRLLADRLSHAIVRTQHSDKMLAICYIDLDGFKRVNDLHGHEAGDQLLINVTRRLQNALREGDTLARLGGDEFVVLFNDLVREQECLQVLERLLDIVAMPVVIGTLEVRVSASIGVTFYPSDDEDGDTLLRHADQAMYVAKQTGKNRYHLYDAAHDQRLRSQHESRRRIEQGLEDGEFELFYQPKIALVSGEVAGVEALIRWHHPERGLLRPAEFLPVIEDSDLEIRLGEWVMDTTLAQLDLWTQDGLALEVSINISARHLQSPDFVAGLERRLARYPQVPRHRLQIEVLETAALEDIGQSAETIEVCRELGISFALDDFGTGYASLTYLRKLLVETLKIDQSFVRGMLTDEGDRAIVEGIIALAKAFGRKTVAEGIETPELVRVLVKLGCTYGQGYGIARPMPAGDFLAWHRTRR